MSVVNLFTRETPSLNGYEFDAVLEDTFEASVELTGYAIEMGARASDHRIINPFTWSLVGAVSNNPLTTSVTDFVGALVPDGAGASTVAGLSAGFLSGSDETRASATLEFLIALMVSGEPFDVDAGDIQLKNMTLVRIRRTADVSNEGGLIFEADLQELPTLEAVLAANQPSIGILSDTDPSYTQASATNARGELSGTAPGAGVTDSIGGLFA